MLQFIGRGLPNVLCQGKRLLFTKEVTSPCTIATDKPWQGPGRYGFEVEMVEKQGKTSVGYMTVPPPYLSFYMTPRHTTQNDIYVSMGGAGFIYPLQVPNGTGVTYAKGDRIASDIIINDDGKGMVQFTVNGKFAGEVAWVGGLQAYPALSCENGVLDCVIHRGV